MNLAGYQSNRPINRSNRPVYRYELFAQRILNSNLTSTGLDRFPAKPVSTIISLFNNHENIKSNMQSHYSPIGTIFKSNMGSRKLRLLTPMAFSEQDGFFLTEFCIGSTYVRSTPGMENGLETKITISLN